MIQLNGEGKELTLTSGPLTAMLTRVYIHTCIQMKCNNLNRDNGPIPVNGLFLKW